ncbi:hypothetical protein [Roseisolibacter agri]|uniref:Membrane protein n=1 Tax=Roseisolibacter agri TaxID=2014610 RepID=A0AA37QGH1_9BACT|nr:hypothetical protein [Roseisolibacter agri]GLC25965.1 membrane protein [Roseisolibacter agri]
MLAAIDSVLELLLKYRPALFAQGRLAFDAPHRVAIALTIGGVLLAALVAWTYARARGGATRRDRALLTGLRVAALAVLVACLLRPVLVLAAAVPRRNTVAILVDDSRSMRVRDWDGRARADAAARLFAPDAPLRRALEAQFGVRVYRFAEQAARVDSLGAMTFAGDRTRLGAALDRLREDLDGVPLAGVVVLTDGADGAPTALGDAVLSLRARGAPVFTIGVGAPAATRDVEVARVEAPRSVLQGSALTLNVVLEHRGLAGTTVPVTVEAEGGHLIARREVTLPASGDALPVQLNVPMADAGARRLTVRVPRQRDETLAENNERTLLVDVRDAPERILYFEGEPRFEAKFVRRAVADDERLRVTVLQRTAEGKYLRLGVTDSLDLIGGFPTTREALFAYRGVILGSVEASAFTAEQQRMLVDFVNVRGGGLLFLGGRRAFAEGGYAGTPLEEAMPVVLGARTPASDDAPVPAVEVTVRPTPAGLAHAPLQLAADEKASVARWGTLPPLTAVNTVRSVRPGASVLLTGTTRDGERRVVLATQRFGRGRTAALAVQDSWLWQMHASIPVEDQTHELLWRQMLRWLTADVPDALELASSIERPAPGEETVLHATVRDSLFVPVNGATVVAEVVAPSGARSELPLEWGVSRDGEYRAAFTPRETGVHQLRVLHRAGSVERASRISYVESAPSREEYFGAGLRADLLRRIAAETRGRYYTPETAGTLAEDLRYARAGVTVAERKELWDMPLTFLLLGGLLAGEWAYRRHRGLA